MERLNAAVADAIARAMTGDEEELVGEEGKERLIAKATADPSFVHSSVQAAMSDPQLLAILRAENLADEILLTQLARGMRVSFRARYRWVLISTCDTLRRGTRHSSWPR